MAAAQMQALMAHDRIKRSTDLPLFYGKKDKDACTARYLISRIETAAQVATWNEARQCHELELALRDNALIWWDTLETHDFPRNNWNIVKREFLRAYEPKYTAKTNCTNFQDLIQRSGEPVYDYYLRVNQIWKRFMEASPVVPPVAVATAIPNAVQAALPVANAALFEDIKDEGFQEGIKVTGKFVLHQLFLAGLKEEIRAKTMEAAKPNIYESVSYAQEIEIIHQDRKKSSHVHSVQETKEGDFEDAPEGMDEDELEAVNALRFQKGKKPFRFNRGRPSNGSNPNRNGAGPNRTNVKCRYCNITGHFQKDCRKRKAARAPMVDQNGKPFQRVNQVQTEDTQVSAVTQGLMALNW
jgi:hypothetical protein